MQISLNQQRLGELVGVASHTVWCWEAGHTEANHEHLVVSFRDAVAGLQEGIESIDNYICSTGLPTTWPAEPKSVSPSTRTCRH